MTRHHTNHSTHDDYTTYGTQGTHSAQDGATPESGGRARGRLPVADRVQGALDGLNVEFFRVTGTRPATDAGWADRGAALALLCARRAGWWRLLKGAADRDTRVHPVFAQAALIAADDARDRARFWRDLAADYRARA